MRISKIIKILVITAAVAGLAFGGYKLYKTYLSSEARAALAASENEYKFEPAASLPTNLINKVGPEDKIFAVYANEYDAGVRDVAVKAKDSTTVTVYRKVSSLTWTDFTTRYFEKFRKDHPDFDYRILDGLEGLGSVMGVSQDPISVIRSNAITSWIDVSLAVFFGLLKFVAFVGVMVFAMIYAQGLTMRNNIARHDPKDIDDTLDDLVGLQDVKKELEQLEEMITHRSLYADFGITKTFNVLLTGPAGVGKTKIARCLAKRLNIPMFYASGASLETGYIGGGPRTLKKLVAKASKLDRAIIFLDEAEGLLLTRDRPVNARYENETMTTLLSMLDGVGSKDSKNIIWILASNFDDGKVAMDEAMLRRFPLKIAFRLPNQPERKEILQRLIDKRKQDVISQDLELDHIATISSGMSPAILESLVARAGLIAIQQKTVITQDVMLKAFERIAVGLTDRATTAKMDKTRRLIAIHECGHFITHLHHSLKAVEGDLEKLANNLDVLKISTESVSKLGALGFVLSKSDELPLSSRREYEQKIVELYGGMANEELILGQDEVTAGAHNDIEKITHLLGMMFNEVGFYSEYKLNFRVMQSTGLDVGQQRFMEIKERSETLYKYTIKVLDQYKDLTLLMADILMKNYVMTQADYIPVIKQFFQDNPRLLAPYIPAQKHRVASQAKAATAV